MKITKYILSLAAAIGLAAGCQKAEMVQMLPMDEVVAPVLSKLPEKIVITPLNMTTDSVVFNWTSADFGVKTQVNYSIEVAEKGGAVKAIVSSGITDTTAVLYYETINSALYESLELLDGTATDVEFSVSAYTGESAKVYSNAVPVNATCTAAEKQYPKMTVVGAYQGWTPGAAQYVYDFKGTDEAYSGLIGFGINDFDMTKNEFKITGTDWGADNGEHSIPEGTEVEPEAAQIPLVNGGGSNILAYQTYKFYHLTFDKKTPALKKNFAFNTVGVIGVNGDWDNDVEMSFHVAKQRFYADIELTADGNFKFRADKGWDLNWGVKDGVVTAGGDNIEAKAGKYRVYLNLNNPENITYELNAKAYGIVEGEATPDTPADPEPEPEPTYGLIGAFNGWADPDVDLVARTDGFYVAKAVEIPAADENKLLIRLNDAWDAKFGFNQENTYLQLGKNTLEANGKDMWIKEGTYDFYFNPTTAELYLANAGDADPTLPSDAKAVRILGDVSATDWTNCNAYIWGDGDIRYAGDWPGTELKTVTIDGKDYYVFEADASMYGKTVNVIFNNGTEQTVDITGVALNNDVVIVLTEKNSDDGKWQATVDGKVPETPETPEPTGQWYLAGSYAGGSSNPESGLMTKEGEYFVLKGVVADGGWMVFTDGTWNAKLAGTFVSVDSPMDVVKVTGQESFTPSADTYDVYLQVAADGNSGKAYFMSQGKTPADATVTYLDASTFEVGLSGSMNDWGAVYVAEFGSKNITDASKFAGTYTFNLADIALNNDSFKIRIKGDWIGVGQAAIEGIDVSGDGDFKTTASGNYSVAISFDWDGLKYSNVRAVFTAK